LCRSLIHRCLSRHIRRRGWELTGTALLLSSRLDKKACVMKGFADSGPVESSAHASQWSAGICDIDDITDTVNVSGSSTTVAVSFSCLTCMHTYTMSTDPEARSLQRIEQHN